MGSIIETEVFHSDGSKGIMALRMLSDLGSGRAAQVSLVLDEREGILYAEKAFRTGNGLSQLTRDIFYTACFQAPFPYRTKENAVRAAMFRRKVLYELTRFWFGEPLIADACYTRWDNKEKAYILGTEYISGQGPKFGPVNHRILRNILYNYSLRLYKKVFSPGNYQKMKGAPWEIEETIRSLDKLKGRFRQAGFLGSEWQVEKALSVPTSNLLKNSDNKWVLVDAESAFPAVALPEYIRRAIKHGSFPLFDDINFAVLHRYLSDNHRALLAALGESDTGKLYYYVDRLEYHTRAWKEGEPAVFRHKHRLITNRQLRRSIRQGFTEHWQKSGWITMDRAVKMQNSSLLFSGYLGIAVLRDILSAFAIVARSLKSVTRRIFRDTTESLHMVYSAFFDEAYLQRVSQTYVMENIDNWHKSGRLSEKEAEKLRQDVESPVAGEYIQNFVAHLGLQLLEPPFVGNAVLVAVAVFFGCPELLGAILISPILRTIYTLHRMKKNRHESIAYNHAFIVGAMPKVGVFAYSVQMAASYPYLSIFLTRFQASRIGRRFPLLGGENTRLEHFCVKTVDLLASLQYEMSNWKKGFKSFVNKIWRRRPFVVNKKAGVFTGTGNSKTEAEL